MADGERRPGHQDHLALLGGGESGGCADARRAQRRDPGAHLALRHGRGPGLRIPRHPGRCRGDPARLRSHGVRTDRAGQGRERARSAGRAPGGFRPLPLDPSQPPQDRRIPEARQRAGCAPPARPRHRGVGAARGGEEGAHRRAGVRGGGARPARDQHRAGAGGDPRLVRGAEARGHTRRLHPGPSPVGHGDRPRQVHRVLRLRHGVLRGEQHPDGGRVGDSPRPRVDLDADRALLGRRRGTRGRLAALRAHALPALRQRALRAGLPGVRRLPHRRRTQRAGVQPVRGHPVLCQQLPVQGALLQLVQVQRGGMAGAAAPPAQPRRHGTGPRRDGEMHLLHSADPRRPAPGPAGGPPAS